MLSKSKFSHRIMWIRYLFEIHELLKLLTSSRLGYFVVPIMRCGHISLPSVLEKQLQRVD